MSGRLRLACLIALSGVILALPLSADASGPGWIAGQLYLPAGGMQVSSLPALSCASTTVCAAVGSFISNPNAHTNPLLVEETAGAWQLQGVEAPLPADAVANASASLSSVSCASVGNCTAVGAYSTDSGTPPLLVTESSGVWRAATPPPDPRGGSWPYIGDPPATVVSCAAAGDCVATTEAGFLLEEAGGTWSAFKAPVPSNAWANQAPAVLGVSCASVGNCVAVGTYADGTGEPTWQGLIETETDSVWSASQAPLPPDAVGSWASGTSLTNVACPSVGNCTAIGMYSSPQGNAQGERGLLLDESNGVWSATPAPLPGDAGTNNQLRLLSLACTSAGNCAVVGTYDDDSSTRHWLVLTETNGTWTADEPPLPSSIALGRLASVTCPTADTCMAAGDIHAPNEIPQGSILTWSGAEPNRQWSELETSLPPDSPGLLDFPAIACLDTSHCSATGLFADGAYTSQGFIATLGSQLVPPLPTIDTGARASAALTKKGAVIVSPGITITCPVVSGSPCQVSATITAKHTALGVIFITLRADGSAHALSFKLSAAGLRRLRQARSLSATLDGLTGIEGDYPITTFQKTFEIKAPKGLKK